VLDNFVRADNASSVGAADTGQTWTVLTTGAGSVLGIQSNKVYSPSNGGCWMLIDSGASDVIVEGTIAALNGSAGIHFRFDSAGTSGWSMNTTSLLKYVSNTATATGSAFTQTFVAGDRYRVIAQGAVITVYRQAGASGAYVQVAQRTDSSYQTNTKHGLRWSTNTGGVNRWAGPFVVREFL